MIKIDTVNNDTSMIQEIVLLYVFKFGVSYQKNKGEHFGIHFGIGPMELNFTVRLWNGTSK
jgi:hypothetical protein